MIRVDLLSGFLQMKHSDCLFDLLFAIIQLLFGCIMYRERELEFKYSLIVLKLIEFGCQVALMLVCVL